MSIPRTLSTPEGHEKWQTVFRCIQPDEEISVDADGGETLKAAREAAGLSLSAMAKQTHFTRGHLCNVETGKRRVTTDVVDAYERVLGSSLDRRNFLALTGLSLSEVAPRRIGAVDVDAMGERFARLRDLDNYLGGADTFRLYSAELAYTEQIAKRGHYDESTRRALARLAAEQAQQVGWAAFDAGRSGDALRLFEYSHRAALEGLSDDLAANAVLHISYATGTPKTASDPAEAVSRVAKAAESPQTRALLESRRAWSMAVAGRPREAAEALDGAHEALASQVGPTAPHWSVWVDSTELDIMTGRVWSVLRQPDRAIPALERALIIYPDRWARDKALYMLFLAEAYADQGSVEQATQITFDAVALAGTVASVRPLLRAGEVARRLARLRAPKSRELKEFLASVTAPIPAEL